LDDYLRRLDEGDVEEGGTGGGARTKNLAGRIAALREKRGRYGAMLADLERTGESQISAGRWPPIRKSESATISSSPPRR
jgi:hypothetical protein